MYQVAPRPGFFQHFFWQAGIEKPQWSWCKGPLSILDNDKLFGLRILSYFKTHQAFARPLASYRCLYYILLECYFLHSIFATYEYLPSAKGCGSQSLHFFTYFVCRLVDNRMVSVFHCVVLLFTLVRSLPYDPEQEPWKYAPHSPRSLRKLPY